MCLLEVFLAVFNEGIFHVFRVDERLPLFGVRFVRDEQARQSSSCTRFHKLSVKVEAFAVVLSLS